METIKSVGLIILVIMFLFSFYINMVLEPRCEAKGFAGVDVTGCWIIKDGVRVYENKQPIETISLIDAEKQLGKKIIQ